MNSKVVLKEIEVEELVKKNVKASGNGGAVWVPKRWLGKDVVVILPKKQKRKKK